MYLQKSQDKKVYQNWTGIQYARKQCGSALNSIRCDMVGIHSVCLQCHKNKLLAYLA